MDISIVEIHTTGVSSTNNQKLFAYLRKNINRINTAKIKIDFFIAKQEDAEQYKKRGIIGFPTLISKGEQITGNSEVENFFNSIINRQNPVSDDEMLANYMRQTVSLPPTNKARPANSSKSQLQNQQQSYVDDDDDDPDNESKKLQNQIQQALRDRMTRDPAFGKGMTPPEQKQPAQQLQKPNPMQKKQRASNIDIPIGNRAKAGLGPANDDDLIRNLLANQVD